jgi:hypothetical protein
VQDAAPPGRPVEVTVVDAVGIGAGGSGAAAGLLHPFTPKGKVRAAPRARVLGRPVPPSSFADRHC